MTLSRIEEFDNRIIFAKTLIKLAQENPKIVVVCNDSIGSSIVQGAFQLMNIKDFLLSGGFSDENLFMFWGCIALAMPVLMSAYILLVILVNSGMNYSAK